jgi:uncharacterized integral membrane protein
MSPVSKLLFKSLSSFHPLPSPRTYNKSYLPTLNYNSLSQAVQISAHMFSIVNHAMGMALSSLHSCMHALERLLSVHVHVLKGITHLY